MGRDFSEFLEAVGEWLHTRRKGIARLVALAVVVIAAPLAAFALLPTFLGMFAPPLDSSKDLYSVNRPLAFTFLDAEGSEVGHRGAIIGARLHLERDAGLSPRGVHRDGRPPVLRSSRHRRARACARAVDQFPQGPCRRGRLHDHPADREDRLHRPGTHAEAQMAGTVRSRPTRKDAVEERRS